MAIVNTLKIYETLKEKVPEEQAKVITEVIEKSFEENRENQKEFLATKEDLAREISRLEIKIEQTKSELIKWMFIFCIGQIGVLTAIFSVIFKR